MEVLLSRYRNLTVLLVVVLAQLIGVAYQVRTSSDQRLIRIWAVTAVTPMAGIVEDIRHNTIGFLQDYFILLDVREQNRKLKADNDKLRMENVYFRNQLGTAANARALLAFQSRTPSRTVAARVIGNSTVASAKAVFIDRGSTSGILKGLAVVTPEGIVGKVTAVYPLVSQVLLVTDPTFKVGIESQKGHVHGVLDCGTGKCTVEQVQNEDKVDVGEWFFTSGEDRIFPKGFPVGTVVSAQPGQGMKDLKLNLSGSPGGFEEVLVVLEGTHQPIPTAPAVQQASASMLPAPPPDNSNDGATAAKPQTEADKIRERYDALGKQENHVFGGYGSNLPDFNPKAPVTPAAPTAAGVPSSGTPAAPSQTKPPAANLPKAINPAPSLLGARPGTPPPSFSVPQPAAPKRVAPPPAAGNAASGQATAPALLGAPRRRTPSTATGSTASPPQP